MKRTLVAVPVLLLTAACGSILPTDRPAETLYALRFPSAAPASGEVKNTGRSLLVSEVHASGILSGNRIVFSEDGVSRGFYQLARWSEPPAVRVQSELIRRLERSGLFSSVARAGGLASGGLLLTLDLLDAYHDISSDPGIVKLSVRAELIGLGEGKILGSAVFEEKADATDYSARGAVDGMQKAYDQLFADLEKWLIQLQSPEPSFQEPQQSAPSL